MRVVVWGRWTALCCIVVLFLASSACVNSAAEEADPEPGRTVQSPPAPKPRIIPVRVARVVREDVTETLDLTGTAEPWDEFRVASEVAGRIARLHAEEGDWVSQGDLLVELDAQKRLLELESRKTNLTRAEIELDFSRKRLARGQALLQKGAMSEADVDTLEQAVQVASATVRSAELAIKSVQEEIKDTRIRAPVAGRVSSRLASLGETVNPGVVLFVLIQVDPLKVVTEVPEPYLHQIRPRQNARLLFEAVTPEPLPGTVHFIHPVANPQSGAFPTEIKLPNRRHLIQPGMVARVSLAASTMRGALMVPLDALVDMDGGFVVYVVRDNLALRTPITIERRVDARAVVSGPLAEGDQVVTSGNQNLVDRTPIEVIS